MQSLFPIEYNFPNGFTYTSDFITEEEERFLLEKIKEIELHAFIFQGYEAKRRVASFGYDYNFNSRSLKEGNPIPEYFNSLIQKVSAYTSIPSKEFTELLVTEYPIGAVINWHRDAPPFDVIVGISLQASCNFKLRPYDKNKQGRSSIISFPVEKRSVYIIKDESRSEWEHSIAPVKQVRYSITLRTLRSDVS
jgi:alkylated DNA repair dioxygenase AlkB